MIGDFAKLPEHAAVADQLQQAISSTVYEQLAAGLPAMEQHADLTLEILELVSRALRRFPHLPQTPTFQVSLQFALVSSPSPDFCAPKFDFCQRPGVHYFTKRAHLGRRVPLPQHVPATAVSGAHSRAAVRAADSGGAPAPHQGRVPEESDARRCAVAAEDVRAGHGGRAKYCSQYPAAGA